MAQQQEIVPLVWKVGSTGKAAATGNNAAWQCVCDREVPLLGRTGLVDRVTDGYLIDCPECERQYFVEPKDKDNGKVGRVIEI